MPAPLLPLLQDLMSDTISVQSGNSAGTHGDWSPDMTSPLVLACSIDGKKLTVDGADGKERISVLEIIVGSVNNLTTDGHRYTLPVRYAQRVDVEAISVETVQDENGPHHEVVFLPMR